MVPKKDADRRGQILDAAQKVFAKKGFNGASIKDLARAAGVSSGLLYWYFKDKTDLFTSLLLERIEEGFDLGHALSFELPPEEFLPHFGRFFLGLFERPMNLALFKVMVANAQSFPKAVRQVQNQVVGRVLSTLQDYFQRQIEAGCMRPCDTEMVTRTFMGSLMAYLLLKHVLCNELVQAIPLEAMVDGASQVVLHGILPEAR